VLGRCLGERRVLTSGASSKFSWESDYTSNS
jgi:hypothetical protein